MALPMTQPGQDVLGFQLPIDTKRNSAREFIDTIIAQKIPLTLDDFAREGFVELKHDAEPKILYWDSSRDGDIYESQKPDNRLYFLQKVDEHTYIVSYSVDTKMTFKGNHTVH